MFTRRCGDNAASGVNYDHATPARADIYSQEKHMFALKQGVNESINSELNQYLPIHIRSADNWLRLTAGPSFGS